MGSAAQHDELRCEGRSEESQAGGQDQGRFLPLFEGQPERAEAAEGRRLSADHPGEAGSGSYEEPEDQRETSKLQARKGTPHRSSTRARLRIVTGVLIPRYDKDRLRLHDFPEIVIRDRRYPTRLLTLTRMSLNAKSL